MSDEVKKVDGKWRDKKDKFKIRMGDMLLLMKK